MESESTAGGLPEAVAALLSVGDSGTGKAGKGESGRCSVSEAAYNGHLAGQSLGPAPETQEVYHATVKPLKNMDFLCPRSPVRGQSGPRCHSNPKRASPWLLLGSGGILEGVGQPLRAGEARPDRRNLPGGETVDYQVGPAHTGIGPPIRRRRRSTLSGGDSVRSLRADPYFVRGRTTPPYSLRGRWVPWTGPDRPSVLRRPPSICVAPAETLVDFHSAIAENMRSGQMNRQRKEPDVAAPVKGQATLDAANTRRQTPKQKATSAPIEAPTVPETTMTVPPNEATLLIMTKESGYEQPKSLRQLEVIVESNALRGAGMWRKAATALLAIKVHKLWTAAKNDKGEKYPSFVVYAEERFGFKKTYAYDLVKAAQRKPEAISETSARAEMRAERDTKPIDRGQAVQRMTTAWDKFESRVGDLRDRAILDEPFVQAFDVAMGVMGDTFRKFLEDNTPVVVEGEVSPIRDESNLPPGHDDGSKSEGGDDVPS